MNPPARHRLAALWFADVVGYTELASRDEDAAIAAAQTLHAAARRVVEAHGGRVVRLAGDAVLAEFASADAAVRAALETRAAFATEAAADGTEPPALRIGVHLGEVAEIEGGDLHGEGVDLAGRIQAAADPGAVWVSEDVRRVLHQRPEFRFEPIGERVLGGDAVALHEVALESDPARRSRRRAAAKRSIAVLPFADLSAGAGNEYFSDGVTEEILTSLARVGGLKVISRTSVMRYKRTEKPIREIGAELGVTSILEGSVRMAGSRVRITAQLIDAATDEHLWAESYDRELEDIFAIQTDVAERIVEALRVRLEPAERERLTGRRTESVEAYQAYLRGRHFLNRRSEANLREAIERFGEATRIDPPFADAWAGLASAWALLPHYAGEPVPEADFEARQAAGRALTLDPESGEAHAAIGNVEWTAWRWSEAESRYRRAIEASPGFTTAYLWYGNFLYLRGRDEEAFDAFRRALELDPVSLPVHMGYGAALNHHRRYEEAIEVYRRALELDPGYVSAHNNLVNPYLGLGRLEDALDAMEAASRVGHEGLQGGIVDRAREGFAAEGERGFWTAVREAMRSRPPGRWRDYFLLQAAARLGRADEAFGLIGDLLVGHSSSALQIPFDPLLDPLRSDPRWAKVLERLELA